MSLRPLGRSNLQVSNVCLGTMMFGGPTDRAEAGRIIASARAQGINFMDTADVYQTGTTETLLGELLAGQRHDWVLASKVGNRMGDGPNQHHFSRSWIMQAVEGSLRRLRTDYLDIYYLHKDFQHHDLEESLRTLGDLIRAGKIRYIGLSNYRGWRIAEAMRLCQAMNIPGPIVVQPPYNIVNREPEIEVLPACQHYGIGTAIYSPLARGILTGKYLPDQPPDADSRAGRGDTRILQTEYRPASLALAAKLKAHCDAREVQLHHFAVAWVLANPAVTSVIAGPRTLSQMEDYYPARALSITAEDETLVDSLVAPGSSSDPWRRDPSHPIFGRLLPRA